MNYVIRYHSKGDKDSYLTNTALLSKKIGSKDILNFSSAISAQNYFNHSLSTKPKETILNNHAKECFQIVKINDIIVCYCIPQYHRLIEPYNNE